MKDYTDLSEYSVYDMRVFKMDDKTRIAAPTLMHALIKYEEIVGELEVWELGELDELSFMLEMGMGELCEYHEWEDVIESQGVGVYTVPCKED